MSSGVSLLNLRVLVVNPCLMVRTELFGPGGAAVALTFEAHPLKSACSRRAFLLYSGIAAAMGKLRNNTRNNTIDILIQ